MSVVIAYCICPDVASVDTVARSRVEDLIGRLSEPGARSVLDLPCAASI